MGAGSPRSLHDVASGRCAIKIKAEGPEAVSAPAVWDRREKNEGSKGWDFPDGQLDGSVPAAPRRTLLDGAVWVVKVVGLVLLFAACFFAPGDGSDGSRLPGWYWMVLGVAASTGAFLMTVGIVYQRHRSPVLDRPAWEAEGRRQPIRCFTRIQVEPGHFEVRDGTSVVADDRIGRKLRSQVGVLLIEGRPYRLRRGSQLFADGESEPVLRVAGKGRITLANGATFSPAGRAAPLSRSWVALKQYRMQRFTNATGKEFMVLRWTQFSDDDRTPVAEARIYVSDDASEVLPLICYALRQFTQARRGRK
jgi:hypothetical protein